MNSIKKIHAKWHKNSHKIPSGKWFIKNLSIVDNVLLALEVIRHMRCMKKGKIGVIALKINISKAFEHVKWNYLLSVLRKIGFHEKWISWMHMYLHSVNFFVVVNGNPVGQIFPRRRLRQCDPLSPYLFILCIEGISSLLKIVRREVISMEWMCVEGLFLSYISYLLMLDSFFARPMTMKLPFWRRF